MKSTINQYIGTKFNKLTLIEDLNKKKSGRKIALFKCDCGNYKELPFSDVKRGRIKSCGCLKPKTHAIPRIRERLYNVWCTMKTRCNNPNYIDYKLYGGKGIKVCDEWLHDYDAFKIWSYANGYDENAERNKCTLDRIDPSKDYEPSNCRWVDFKIQSNHTNKNHCVEYNGEKHTISEWANITGINYSTLRSRINSGMPLDKIFYNGNLCYK